jgi:hypothetical protein
VTHPSSSGVWITARPPRDKQGQSKSSTVCFYSIQQEQLHESTLRSGHPCDKQSFGQAYQNRQNKEVSKKLQARLQRSSKFIQKIQIDCLGFRHPFFAHPQNMNATHNEAKGVLQTSQVRDKRGRQTSFHVYQRYHQLLTHWIDECKGRWLTMTSVLMGEEAKKKQKVGSPVPWMKKLPWSKLRRKVKF